MGSDDIFHKRKAKSIALNRKKPQRALYDKVLIVCEGEKTEPLYFQELVDYYKIHSANVKISGDCGSSPKCVLEHGIQLYVNEKKSDSGPFDRVYCVIDRDAHIDYQATLDRINAQKPAGVFFAANSIPCFEYWLLLHFTYTCAPFNTIGNTTSGMAALSKLKEFWPEYTKGSCGSFDRTKKDIEFAIANAKRALNEANKNGSDNPSTRIHDLVEYLKKIIE